MPIVKASTPSLHLGPPGQESSIIARPGMGVHGADGLFLWRASASVVSEKQPPVNRSARSIKRTKRRNDRSTVGECVKKDVISLIVLHDLCNGEQLRHLGRDR